MAKEYLGFLFKLLQVVQEDRWTIAVVYVVSPESYKCFA